MLEGYVKDRVVLVLHLAVLPPMIAEIIIYDTYVKTKTQISCAVTAQLISAFIFATLIIQCLFLVGNP